MTPGPKRIFPCPRCGKKTVYDASKPYRPFCSERCQIMDAGNWADESYRVAGPPASVEEIPQLGEDGLAEESD